MNQDLIRGIMEQALTVKPIWAAFYVIKFE